MPATRTIATSRVAGACDWVLNVGPDRSLGLLDLLPRHLAADLQSLSQLGRELIEHCSVLVREVVFFQRVRVDVVQLEWLKRAVLQQLPGTSTNCVDRLPLVTQIAFASSEVPQVANGGLLLAQQCWQDTATFNRVLNLRTGQVADCRVQVHAHGCEVGLRTGFDSITAVPLRTSRDLDATFVDVNKISSHVASVTKQSPVENAVVLPYDGGDGNAKALLEVVEVTQKTSKKLESLGRTISKLNFSEVNLKEEEMKKCIIAADEITKVFQLSLDHLTRDTTKIRDIANAAMNVQSVQPKNS